MYREIEEKGNKNQYMMTELNVNVLNKLQKAQVIKLNKRARLNFILS